ncbi:MAG: hypothetical protein E7508_01275 [Ruminococcus sp.]|nr:hypothetical protein [Ruminococcus sp.]
MRKVDKEYYDYETSNASDCVQIAIKGLKKYLGSNICVSAKLSDEQNKCNISKDKLFAGEISAVTYSIGAYLIRESLMLYKDNETVNYLERKPAEYEIVEEFREKNCLEGTDFVKHRIVNEIYVANKDDSVLNWHFVCRSAKDTSWCEKIRFIGTIKKNVFVSDKNSDLFVFITCTAQNYWSGVWYGISSDGTIKKYPIPYDEKYLDIKHTKGRPSKSKECVADKNTILENIISEIFISSEEMKTYLCEHKSEFSKYQIIDMIASSTNSLESKLKMFEQLAETENLASEIAAAPHDIDSIIGYSYSTYAVRIRKALNELNDKDNSSMFMSYTYKWIQNKFEVEEKKSYLSGEEAIYDTDFGSVFAPSPLKMNFSFAHRLWYIIEKVQKNSSAYITTYQYILKNGYIPYFQCIEDDFKVYPNPHLNLPVPFKSGDIITVSDEPFAEKKQALILDTGDNNDSNCVKVLYITNGGVLKVNSLKHGHIFEDDNAMMYTSPLYKIKKYNGELLENDEILLKIQKYMEDKQYEPSEYYDIFSVLNDKGISCDNIEKIGSFLGNR